MDCGDVGSLCVGFGDVAECFVEWEKRREAGTMRKDLPDGRLHGCGVFPFADVGIQGIVEFEFLLLDAQDSQGRGGDDFRHGSQVEKVVLFQGRSFWLVGMVSADEGECIVMSLGEQCVAWCGVVVDSFLKALFQLFHFE